MSTKDYDLGYQKILKNLRKIKKNTRVETGFIRQELHNKTGGKSVIQVAYENEFGGGRTPERSFIRSTFDKNIRLWTRYTRMLCNSVATGKISIETAMLKAGKIFEKAYKEKIMAGDSSWKPLSERRIREKGHDRPLQETYQMLNAIKSKMYGVKFK